jgi:hypothetical protein
MVTCSEESHGAGRSDGSEVRVVLEEILLQLGEDVLPVRVLPQRRDVRPEHKETLYKASEARRRLTFVFTSMELVRTFTLLRIRIRSDLKLLAGFCQKKYSPNKLKSRHNEQPNTLTSYKAGLWFEGKIYVKSIY